LLNRKSLLLSLLSMVFVSGVAFASNLTERNIYGILSDNFSGALQERGQSTDNIRLNVWAESAAPSPVLMENDPTGKEGWTYMKFVCLKKGATGVGAGGWSGISYCFVKSDNSTAQPTDISHFRYLDFWIRLEHGSLTQLNVGITSVGQNCTKSLSNCGVTNTQGTWQHVVIDLNTLGANLSSVTNTFLVICDNLTVDTTFSVDNIVLRTADSSSANFNITLKNVETMQNIPSNPNGNIIWKESVFHNDWQAACQYIELDMDKYSCAWTVRIYTNNGGTGRGGMWAQGTEREYVIPMCWRATKVELKNQPGKESYIIAQSTASHHNLYDAGLSQGVDEGYYTWFYMKDRADLNFNDAGDLDYITVWDSSLGFHGEVNAVGKGYYDFQSINRKPRIYFGGGFNEAAGGITYVGNVVLEYNLE